MSKGTKQRLLHEGVKLFGREAMSAQLRVPLSLLDIWLRGLATMPDRKLLLLADLILEKLDHPPKK